MLMGFILKVQSPPETPKVSPVKKQRFRVIVKFQQKKQQSVHIQSSSLIKPVWKVLISLISSLKP